MIAFNRNWVGAISALADCKCFVGPIAEVIPLQELALRLSPRDPLVGNMYGRIGRVHLLQSRNDEAIMWFERARGVNSELPYVHVDLAAAYGLTGQTEFAAAELAEARRLSSDDRFSSVARFKAIQYFGVPKIRALFEATYFVGLRKAGMPEE